MDFLKAEIARKKRKLEEDKLINQDKKYFKRGDLHAKEVERATQEAKEKEQKHKEEAEELRKFKEEGKAKSKSCFTFSNAISNQRCPVFFAEATVSAESFPLLPRVEVMRRLRERLEPITLFGEDEDEACKRLRNLEMNEPEKVEGIRNDFK